MKILCVAAHQDDTEFHMGGLCTLYSRAGHEVRILSACNGCGGHHILSPQETSKKRWAESQKVGELFGAKYDVFHDIDDCSIMPTLEMRRRFIRYIREFSPDIIITHRPNDYHADHRNVALLVQDASYMLTVPHECPDVPAMRCMPVILFHDDRFKIPPFRADIVIDVDSVIDVKFKSFDINASQVYEWLPYVNCDPREVPPESDHEARFKFMLGEEVTFDTTDEEVLAMKLGQGPRQARPAALFRRELIAKYGEERGSKIRFAEAFQISEYGKQPTDEELSVLFPF